AREKRSSDCSAVCRASAARTRSTLIAATASRSIKVNRSQRQEAAMWFSRDMLRVVITLGAVAVVAALVGRDVFGAGATSRIRFGMAGVIDSGAWTEKMIRKATASGPDWEAGVRNPSKSPTGQMKKAKGRFKTAMTQALADDSWGKAIDKLTDQDII